MCNNIFDSQNTLTLLDLRLLDEVEGSLLKARADLEKFVVENPQLSINDNGRIKEVYDISIVASFKLRALRSFLRHKIYDRTCEADECCEHCKEYQKDRR